MEHDMQPRPAPIKVAPPPLPLPSNKAVESGVSVVDSNPARSWLIRDLLNARYGDGERIGYFVFPRVEGSTTGIVAILAGVAFGLVVSWFTLDFWRHGGGASLLIGGVLPAWVAAYAGMSSHWLIRRFVCSSSDRAAWKHEATQEEIRLDQRREGEIAKEAERLKRWSDRLPHKKRFIFRVFYITFGISACIFLDLIPTFWPRPDRGVFDIMGLAIFDAVLLGGFTALIAALQFPSQRG